MRTDFRLPDLGEGVHEGEVVRIMVEEGQRVSEDQALVEVETDKARVEIPSPFSGVVAKIHVAEKQVVNVGDVMVTFETTAATPAAVAAKAPPNVAPRAHAAPAQPAAPPSRLMPASPAVRRLARDLGVDLEKLQGSGPGGRVQREDVERAAPWPSRPAAAPHVPSLGRVLLGPPGVGAGHAGTPGTDTWGPTRREAISRARRTIAETMARSASTIPHVTDSDDADITDLDRLRRGHERKLTILPFVVRACAMALRKHPVFNATFDAAAGEIVHRDYVSIAIAVHTPRGLIAPVIRGADGISIAQLASALAALASKARTASFEVNDTRGGTFTISNAGAMGGSRYSTPIINDNQSAILALGRSRTEPRVVEGAIVPRLVLPLSLSFDHRIIDGAMEVAFMQEIITLLEHPARLVI